MHSSTVEATIPVSRSSLPGIIECLRLQQWVKNGFVVAPLVFSKKLLDPSSEWKAFVAAFAFCLVASAVYCWNDILDWRTDLLHPQKKFRPIPAGRVSIRTAAFACVLLLLLGFGVAFTVTTSTGVLLCIYTAINFLYGRGLKHVVVMDLMCISLGFVLRILAGAAAIQAEPSHWLLICTFLLALTLSIFRRRHEAITLGAGSAHHRRVLADYSIAWFDQAGTMLSAATLVCYALYTVAPETQARFGTDHLVYTLPFVVFGMLRYLYLVHSGNHVGNPSSALIADKPLLACVGTWLACCAVLIYSR